MVDEVRSVVIAVVREQGHVDGNLPLDADLYSEVGVESTRSILILVALEETFGMTIDDSEFVKSRSVNSLVDLVRRERP